MLRAACSALLVAAALGGCVTDAPQTPLLQAPMMLLGRTADDQTQIVVQSAVGTRAYTSVIIQVENETVVDRDHTYTADWKTDAAAFALQVDARTPSANFTVAALVRADPEEPRARVALYDHDRAEYGDFRNVTLPWQKILDELRQDRAEASP